MTQKSLTNKNGEVRSLTKKDFKSMKPIDEILSKNLLGAIEKRKRGQRGKQKAPKKIHMSIRVNPLVVKHFKNLGTGWQVEINNVLENHVKRCNGKENHIHRK